MLNFFKWRYRSKDKSDEDERRALVSKCTENNELWSMTPRSTQIVFRADRRDQIFWSGTEKLGCMRKSHLLVFMVDKGDLVADILAERY